MYSMTEQERMHFDVGLALARLGGTSSAVAASLQRAGINGYRSSHGGCPIANYLRGVLGRCEVSVSSTSVVAVPASRRFAVELPLPSAVQSFIYTFDRGAWEELALSPPVTVVTYPITAKGVNGVNGTVSVKPSGMAVLGDSTTVPTDAPVTLTLPPPPKKELVPA